MLRKKHKVAVATRDGERVCPHFGIAEEFHVFDIEGGKVVGREVRHNIEPCSHGEGGRTGGCWDLVEDLLPDVKVVISAGMGENAYVGILRRDILPLVTDEVPIEDALQAYLRGELKEKSEKVHPS
ncbi:MAG: NifB/NifX family molybdenum-iron cluster-binding protein [Actinomycetota bacterium]|nr:NifB/NifX family molybdenum-iron cluster-binding protein [Actinomycetota bacterium]